MKVRVGFGYDVHRLVKGLPFALGGITIKHTKGSLGHSDGDVLIHAICDALLGAANLRDIGYHFPDKSEEFKGIDSKILLQKTYDLVLEKGFSLQNMDATICLQSPKINSHIPEMKSALAGTMNVSEEDISIKATTTERMGFVGSEDGVSAYAVVLISK